LQLDLNISKASILSTWKTVIADKAVKGKSTVSVISVAHMNFK